MNKFMLFAPFLFFLGMTCSKSPQKNDISANSEKKNVETLYNYLKQQSGKKILFGQQDALAYGVGWEYEEGKSDIKSLVNDLPAVIGWDIGNIANEKNLDSVPFTFMREKIIKTFQRGGISTLSWHT